MAQTLLKTDWNKLLVSITSVSPSQSFVRAKNMDHFPAHGWWAPATPTQDSDPVTPRQSINSTEKWPLYLKLTSSSQASSVHKGLSLEVVCPRLGDPAGMGRMGHVTFSFGTVSAPSYHLPACPGQGWLLLLPHGWHPRSSNSWGELLS